MTTCKFCNKEFSEHKGREWDVCVAKAEGWAKVRLTPMPRSKRIRKPITVLSGYPQGGINRIVVPRYHDNLTDAMTLWEDGWEITKLGTNEFVTSIYTDKPTGRYFPIIATTVPLILCHRTLIEASKGE